MPTWWANAPVEAEGVFEGCRQPLLRIVALSIPWFWLLALCSCLFQAFDSDYSEGLFEFVWNAIDRLGDLIDDLCGNNLNDFVSRSFAVLLAPIVADFAAGVAAFLIKVSVLLVAYAVNAQAFSIDWQYTVFLAISLGIALPAVAIFAPFFQMIGSMSLATRLLGLVATVLNAIGMIFTIRDVIHLLRS